MKDWEFNELVEAIDESFSNYIADGLSTLDAGSYTIDDFWYFNKPDECVENLLIVTSTLLNLIKYNRVFDGTKKLFESTLKSISEDTIKSSLSESEINLLEAMIENLKVEIQNVELIYDPEEK